MSHNTQFFSEASPAVAAGMAIVRENADFSGNKKKSAEKFLPVRGKNVSGGKNCDTVFSSAASGLRGFAFAKMAGLYRMVNCGEKFDYHGCPNRWRWEWIFEEVEIREGESVLKERVRRRLHKIDVKGQAWCLLCECTVSYGSRGLCNLTDHFETSRRVNPQKRVLEKTRQKSVGPAEKKTKADSYNGSRDPP